MTTVTVPLTLGGDGAPFSDQGEAARDMQGLGYAEHFFPLLAQVMPALSLGIAGANSALTAPGTMATSITSLTLGTGDQSLTIQAGKAYSPGQRLVIASTATPALQMSGVIKSYNAATGALVVTVDEQEGTGTLASWSVALQGKNGQSGVIGRVAISAATTLDYSHKCKLVDVTGGTFALAFAPCATLKDGWSCLARNGGTGDVTLDPSGAETIDGLASFVLYPGAVRLVMCDGTTLRSIPLVGGTKTFTLSGSYVWAPGINQWDVDLIGGGGGGSGGARSTVRYNGGGAGAGERYKARLHRAQVTVGGSTTCTVGGKGVGGVAAAADNSPDNAYVNAGTDGGNSAVGSLAVANGGKGAQGAYNAAHGQGGNGGGKATSGVSNAATGQTYSVSTTSYTEWGGANGRSGGTDATDGVTAALGGQKSGAAGDYVAAGAPGANATNPGDGGNGGAGNLNGSPAGKGSDGADGKITITEVI